MSTTHAAMGATLAVLVVPIAPELASVAALGAIAGGVFPDLDVLGQHRKTLHYPEHYWLVAVPALAIAVGFTTRWTVAGAGFLVSAGLHSSVDVLGGGLGLRPWSSDDDRGVYSHWRGRWIRARRWVRYDGAPEDLLVVAVFSIPPLLVFDGQVRTVVVAGLVVSTVYVAIRRRLPDLYEAIL